MENIAKPFYFLLALLIIKAQANNRTKVQQRYPNLALVGEVAVGDATLDIILEHVHHTVPGGHSGTNSFIFEVQLATFIHSSLFL